MQIHAGLSTLKDTGELALARLKRIFALAFDCGLEKRQISPEMSQGSIRNKVQNFTNLEISLRGAYSLAFVGSVDM